ncbi:hypothetical protein [Reichenbachiella sp.]|uniref:hypothetical protein n=1 Tax=Reichenbachiella sp. TaxID=2184521 RepID=UPI003B5B58C6
MSRLSEILAENSDAAKNRIGEIHTFITDEVDDNAQLDFDSSSKTSEWNLWIELMSFISYIQETLWGEAKAELTQIKEEGIAANKYFFAREWSKFQFGDDLLVNDNTGKYYYEVVDPDKQIIKRLAIIQGTNSWILKVATEDNDGKPIALTPEQLSAFNLYVDRTQPPGPAVTVLSLNSDKLDARFTVYYNPLEPLEDLKPLVEAAYLDYLAEIDINGDSVYYISKHVDALQVVPNVKDVVTDSVQAKKDEDVYANVDRKYEPFSGYLELDPALSFDDLITYVAE